MYSKTSPNTLYPAVPRDCAELYNSGVQRSGVYTIDPDNAGSFDVFCNQTLDGGGWTVLQKKLNPSFSLDRDWCQYKEGFGNLSGDFWLGLDKMYHLTKGGRYKLRIDLDEGNFFQIHSFEVQNEDDGYKLKYEAPDGKMNRVTQNGKKFSTKDWYGGQSDKNCESARHCKRGWWYKHCEMNNIKCHWLEEMEEMKIKPTGRPEATQE